MKVASTKRFADKNEMSKNIKYLDNQIKHVVDVFIKKVERSGDNWLIAKKPLEGYKCGSCETYIGDIHDKNQQVLWNRYPPNQKDPNEKTSYNVHYFLCRVVTDFLEC